MTTLTKGNERLDSGVIPVVIPNTAGMKEIAIAMTYSKRLSFSAAFGIVSDDDIDAPPDKGEQIEAKSTKSQPKPKPLNHAPLADGSPSEAQIKRLYTLATNAKWQDGVLKGLLMSVYGLKSSKELSIKDYNFLCSMLEEGCSPDQVVAEINKERK